MIDLIPLPIRIGLMAVVIIGAGFGGWGARGWKEDAARLDAERQAHANYVAIADGYAAAIQEVGRLRAEDQQQATADRQAFQRTRRDEKNKGTQFMVCGSGLDNSGSDPTGRRVRFDPAFVRLWNDGLDIGIPKALRAAGSDDRRPATGLSASR